MARPPRFEEHRYLGDKRNQVFYDLDADDLDQTLVDDVMKAETFLAFAPDSIPEARNRGYHLWRGHHQPED
jgi:hypothetical protein